LRQDPNVIMVGEIRDQETASIALQSAQTGHLVLSTLHTNTAAGAVVRLRDLGAAPYLVASSLGGVVATRLVRKLCPECAIPAPQPLRESLAALQINPERVKIATGCPHCDNTGYAGRTGVFSFLEVNDELRIAIRENKGEHELEACDPGFISLGESALALLEGGVTSLEEIEHALGPVDSFARTVAARRHRAQPGVGAVAKPAGLARRRVLLVEDDENTRVVLGMILRKEMFDVVEAANGIEGIERVYSDAPEIIVCDLMMPKMNGTEMVQKLRRDPRTRNIPVLMLTAASSEDNEVRSLDCGVDDFVSKTANPKVMLLRLQRLLNRP
jgi:CheY-like chemotaxis protein